MKVKISPSLFFLILILINTNVSASEEFENDIRILNSKFSYSDNKNDSYITCIGELENVSANAYGYITLQAEYFNNKGVIIDTVTEQLYSHVLLPGKTISFRVNGRAYKDAEQYNNHKIKVTYAELKCIEEYSPDQNKKNWMLRIFISWGPMLLLISVWIFFIYRFNRNKNSPQAQSVAALKKQIELLEHQNILFEKLIERIKSK